MNRCPACQSKSIENMFDMGDQPMSLVSLKNIESDSANLKRYPIRLSICRNCTHVFNRVFDLANVNYSAEGCRMYNDGSGWQAHLDEVRGMIEPIVGLDLIVEIGAGDCTFLDSLNMDAVKLAVDPSDAVLRAEEFGIHYDRAYFDPDKHITPGAGSILIIARHLLEHMPDPREFLERIADKTRERVSTTFIYLEVPSCENALRHRRIEDWTYEHPQHFTINSIRALLRSCGLDHFMVIPGYGDEVLKVLVKAEPITKYKTDLNVDLLLLDYENIDRNIVRERAWVKAHQHTIALWGGAGKSAMFIRRMGLDHTPTVGDLTPGITVVDSHEEKQGMYVPGTRLQILGPRQLFQLKPDYIIATASWRANDIRDEIVQFGYPCQTLLKFEGGELTEVPLGR